MSVINETVNSDKVETGCITLGRVAPDFTALSTDGYITLSQFRGKWVVLVSEPGDFAATSTTSIIELTKHYEEFRKRNVEILVVTIDNNFANIEWLVNIYENHGIVVPFPLLEDLKAEIAHKYGMVNPDRVYAESVRDLFIIGPEGKIRAILTYPVSCGRNTYEVLRIIDSLQLTEAYNVYTPSNWMPGDLVMVPTTHTFRDAMIRKERGSNFGLDCVTWYNCYTEYDSLRDTNRFLNIINRNN
ncbi:MAG: redoxin domain-containing protein [Sedimentibacter sp.]|uniref:redoxin domain-containing protein n=1 Tax=Sedimentibacter sp. TaxID=1960295 RepID=UPI00315830F8